MTRPKLTESIYIPSDTWRDPHVAALSNLAYRLWSLSLFHRQLHGVVISADVPRLTSLRTRRANDRLVRELVEGGFWLKVDGGWWPVPDWREPR
jgi:hypothetical protein